MATIPSINGMEALRIFKDEGYNFIQAVCRKYNTNIFQTTLFFKDLICMHGRDAAAVFYDASRFERRGAIPKRVQKTLVGENGVQTLDGEHHRIRKAMFMSLMTPGNMTKLMELIANYWVMYIRRWEKMDAVALFRETQEIFCRAACSWAGVPLHEEEVRLRTDDFTAMVDAFGAVGPRHWRGRISRKRTEAWIMEVVEKVYREELRPTEGSALQVITTHRDMQGRVLDRPVAAVEIMNIIRPIVAISYYVTFSALALHDYPGCVIKLQGNDLSYIENFVQEVRRFYPFAPFVGARVKEDFEWNTCDFKKDTLVFLDIYGLHHDPGVWKNPDQFIPERFAGWSGDPFSFIPQGGGDYATGHRCAGERITIEAMKLSILHLINFMTYNVPSQDLMFSLSRIPTYPESGLVINQVRSKEMLTPDAAIEVSHLV